MEEKETFGKYILQKRKESGLSQKALAEKLFVSESAVSKWERGLSYPDITLVTSLCEALHISEHELLTASDDMHQREIERQSLGYLRIIKTYSWVTYLGYAAALIPTFIWGTVTHHMSVFFILAAALMLAFSVINVPVLAKHHKPQKTFWCFYGSLILLLCVCRLANVEAESQHWLIMAILGISLGLFGVFLPLLLNADMPEHPLKYQKGLICMAIDTIFVYLLVFFGCLFYTPVWRAVMAENLLTATIIAAFAWVIFALFRYTGLSRLLKSFLTAELCGIAMFFTDNILYAVLNHQAFSMPSANFHNWNMFADQNTGVIVMICAAVLIVITLIRDIHKKNR